MYMNVLPVYGRYRGISRTLIIPKIKSGQDWDDLFNDFEQYVAWRIAGGRVYRWGMFQLLSKLCAELNRYSNTRHELILFSDQMNEPVPECDFLGFDVAGDVGESAIQAGNPISEEYAKKLNKYGLFSSYSDAAEFCQMWNSLIQTDESPWAVEVSPRPFRVWHYTSRDGETPVFFP